MVDRSKLMMALHNVSDAFFDNFAAELREAQNFWQAMVKDANFLDRVRRIQQPILIPSWSQDLDLTFFIAPMSMPYTIISVDGSQIYYDKHQGMPCFLIHIGYMMIRYGLTTGLVKHGTELFVTTTFDQSNDFGSPDFVNMQREAYEFDYAIQLSAQALLDQAEQPLVCFFDGSLIFFHLQDQDIELCEKFLSIYCHSLEQLRMQQILVAGYMSFPCTKELINLCSLYQLEQLDPQVTTHRLFDRLTDRDVAEFYIKPGHRSILFKSKAPICYVYPPALQPYFCYLHVGSEIVRLEFPAWIAEDCRLVDQVCAVALDQVIKGKGYPVALFEAHEKAVVTSADRDFFYAMIQRMSHKQSRKYQISQKSLKKLRPIL